MSARTSTRDDLRRFATALVLASPRLALANVLLAFAVGLFEGVGLLALVPLLQLVGLETGQGPLGSIGAGVSRAFAAVGLVPTLPAVLVLYVGIIAVQSVLIRRTAVVQTLLREHVVHVMRMRLYRAIAGTTWVYFSGKRADAFTELLMQKVDRVANAAYYLLDLLVTGITALAYAVLAFRVSPPLTAFVAGGGALLLLVQRHRFMLARTNGRAYTDAATRLYEATVDHIASLKMAKGYGAEVRHAEAFARLSEAFGHASRRSTDTVAATRQSMAIASAALLALLVYVAQVPMQMSAASLLLLIFLFARLVPRLTAIYERLQILLLDLPAFDDVMQAEAACLAAAEPATTVHEAIRLERAVACDHVTFAYGGADGTAALQGVSLRIAAHATTAIVGPSGAGKSTLADLLMGLVTPQRGGVSVDGITLGPERLRAWREQVGYVPQDTFLFHDTVRANLLWARPDADDAAIWRALDRAEAADFVRALPSGLDTLVGDRGLLLSGGERQRLSLARALLRDPQVLILDEATSALDSENERRIQQAIEDLHEQVTIVVITHRLSTIRNADVIHVLENGTVVESGNWTSLLEAPGGRFRRLCEAQGIQVPPHLPVPS